MVPSVGGVLRAVARSRTDNGIQAREVPAATTWNGYSFDPDGSTLYQSIAALFLAQLYAIHMGLVQPLTLVVVLALTSKGTVGIPVEGQASLSSRASTACSTWRAPRSTSAAATYPD